MATSILEDALSNHIAQVLSTLHLKIPELDVPTAKLLEAHHKFPID